MHASQRVLTRERKPAAASACIQFPTFSRKTSTYGTKFNNLLQFAQKCVSFKQFGLTFIRVEFSLPTMSYMLEKYVG